MELGCCKVGDTLGFLLGRWRIERWVDDHRSGARGSFEGDVTFVEARPCSGGTGGDRALYREVGEMRWGAYTGPAARSLDYERVPGATVMVHFADGRLFVGLDLRSGAWRAVHVCGADRYEITTLVCSRDIVEERWRVRGPAKSYDAVATLFRSS